MPDLWATVLDDLEQRLLDPLAEDIASWRPPQHLPPLPAQLVPRVLVLRSAQQRTIDRLESERRVVSAELSSTRRTNPHREQVSVYFDASA